jgi:hypothetical protein
LTPRRSPSNAGDFVFMAGLPFGAGQAPHAR